VKTTEKSMNRLILYWPNEQVLDVTPAATNNYHWALKD
jgi:hypothetical protein